MVKPTRPASNGFVALMRMVYNPLGFSKGYNFVLFFISIGYLFGFTLARLEYLSFYGVFCNPKSPPGTGAAPGECFFWLQNPYRVAMQMHLYTVLPAALLVCLQFVPAIRHKFILMHRINGYLVIILTLISNATVLVLAPVTFGGTISTRIYVGVAVISTTISYIFAYINIKRLQIDQHRAWMMRAWAYFSTIITLRLIMFSGAAIQALIGNFFSTIPCAKINFVLGKTGTLQFYPGCASFYRGNAGQKEVLTAANFNSANPIELTASLDINFGAAGFLALWIHAILIELYLQLTPKETERLRQVSYERQRERGLKHPGSAGLTSYRFGDAEDFVPHGKRNTGDPEGYEMLNRGVKSAYKDDDGEDGA